MKLEDTIKKIIKETIPVAMGAASAGIVRATGLPSIVLAVPPILQLTQRYNPYVSNEYKTPLAQEIWNIAKYVTGAALLYADKIYATAQELVDKM